MNKTAILLLILLSWGSSVWAIDTNYVGITEIKVWTAYIDIYTEAEHECMDQQKHRYNLRKEEKEMFSILLTAMTAKNKVSLNYVCSNNKPQINGVRVKP